MLKEHEKDGHDSQYETIYETDCKNEEDDNDTMGDLKVEMTE